MSEVTLYTSKANLVRSPDAGLSFPVISEAGLPHAIPEAGLSYATFTCLYSIHLLTCISQSTSSSVKTTRFFV